MPPEPWRLREVGFDPDCLGRTESLFALANGHLGVRGLLDEGEPCDLPGTYLSGCYESYPLSYPESGYGDPATGELMINVTDGTLIRLLVDDEPFDLREGCLLDSERVLDFRTGVLTRSVRWRSPAGSTISVTSARLVPFRQRDVLAIDYRVEAVDRDVHLTVHSELRANRPVPERPDSPVPAQVAQEPLVAEQHHSRDDRHLLVHHTRRSGFRVAAAVEHHIDARDTDVTADSTIDPDGACTVVSVTLQAWPVTAAHQVRGVRLLILALGRCTGRPDRCGAEPCHEERLGRPDRRPAAVSRRVLLEVDSPQRMPVPPLSAPAESPRQPAGRSPDAGSPPP